MRVYVAQDHHPDMAVFDSFEKAEQWIKKASGLGDDLEWEEGWATPRRHWTDTSGEVQIDLMEVQ